jgi:hypothetical protein
MASSGFEKCFIKEPKRVENYLNNDAVKGVPFPAGA